MSRLAAALAGFRRARDGATAVEFALIAAPFLFALLATMEIALVIWSDEVLEKAVASASRKIYTGEFQSDGANATLTEQQLQAKVKQTVCDEIKALVKCDALHIDVRGFSSFEDASKSETTSKFDTTKFGYKPIAARQIGLVTAAAEYKTFFPPLGGAKLPNGNRLLLSTAAFRAEPYAN